jgi:hypothetical protein
MLNIKTPRSSLFPTALLLALSLSSVLEQAARAQEIIPIDRIKPGMKGYGLTVFTGFKVERFEVEVIDVLKNFLPKQDLFLVRASHPILSKSGVVGGMSGSPIYLEGKLAGALAYGWRFAKEPIAGITPISSMLDLRKVKLRGPKDSTGGKEGVGAAPGAGQRGAAGTLGALSASLFRLPLAAVPAPAPEALLAQVAVPLSVAGFTPESMALIRESFEGLGFEPVQGGGGGGRAGEGPSKFEQGGALGVQLVRGDMNLSATGTVSWMRGREVMAFGHRMFNAGEIYLPVVTARIAHTLANVQRSFKISSPLREIGCLVLDRQAGIVADTDKRTSMVPISIVMTVDGEKRVFKADVVRHKLLTPNLVANVLSGALTEALPDVASATYRIATRFSVKGYPPVLLEDHLHATAGVRITAPLFSRGPMAIRKVLDNEFAPAFLERVDFDIDVKFSTDLVEITGIKIASNTVDPGGKIDLEVTYRPFDGKDFTKAYSIRVPRTMAGTLLAVDVASGTMVRPDRAPPQNLGDLLKEIESGYPSKSVVVSLSTPTEGLKLRGNLLRDLPASVLDALATSSEARTEETMQTVNRQVLPTQQIVTGRKMIRVRVNPEVQP